MGQLQALYLAKSQHLMQLTLSSMNENDAREYIAWRYDAPYDIYNVVMDDNELRDYVAFCVDPSNRMFAIRDSRAEMVGFCVYGADARINGGDYRQDALDIGMGIRPDHTGRGLGGTFAGTVIQHALLTYRPNGLRVTILDYNTRAKRVWQRLGFEQTQVFASLNDGSACVVLSRRASWNRNLAE